MQIYIRSEDMYETECDLTLRLAAIESSPGNSNHHGNNSVCGVSRDLRGSRDLCESREQHDHVTSSAGGMCASNEYSADPTPNVTTCYRMGVSFSHLFLIVLKFMFQRNTVIFRLTWLQLSGFRFF